VRTEAAFRDMDSGRQPVELRLSRQAHVLVQTRSSWRLPPGYPAAPTLVYAKGVPSSSERTGPLVRWKLILPASGIRVKTTGRFVSRASLIHADRETRSTGPKAPESRDLPRMHSQDSTQPNGLGSIHCATGTASREFPDSSPIAR
jgi:hypothetical protein